MFHALSYSQAAVSFQRKEDLHNSSSQDPVSFQVKKRSPRFVEQWGVDFEHFQQEVQLHGCISEADGVFRSVSISCVAFRGVESSSSSSSLPLAPTGA